MTEEEQAEFDARVDEMNRDPDAQFSGFWDRVARGADDECWPWRGSVAQNGYGRMKVNGVQFGAHRISFRLSRGRWPLPECCHSCDSTSCVNPTHLFEGTQLDNAKDRNSKGRHAHGESNAGHKLTPSQVIDIRANRALCRVSLKALGDRFGVSQTQVSRIVRRLSWGHL